MEQTKNDNLTKIKALLEGGVEITTLFVLQIVGTLEARHYLSILRKEGLLIKDKWVSNGEKRWKVWWVDISK